MKEDPFSWGLWQKEALEGPPVMIPRFLRLTHPINGTFKSVIVVIIWIYFRCYLFMLRLGFINIFSPLNYPGPPGS